MWSVRAESKCTNVSEYNIIIIIMYITLGITAPNMYTWRYSRNSYVYQWPMYKMSRNVSGKTMTFSSKLIMWKLKYI